MKLQQYVTSFAAPLANEDPNTLVRLLACHNKTARGLSDSVGAIEVGLGFAHICSCAAVWDTADAGQERRLANPGHSLPEPWDGIALRHCACVHALYSNHYQEA
jgi:hypothetical protein